MGRYGPRLKVRHLLAVVAAVALVLSLDTRPAVWASGAFPLEVTLKLPPGRKVVAVEALVISTMRRAEIIASLPVEVELFEEEILWVPDRPFVVMVHCWTGRSLLTNRALSSWQHEAFVLRLQYADGTRRRVLSPIPHGRGPRTLTVMAP